MTTYAEVRLRKTIADNGTVELTVVAGNGSSSTEVHNNIDEAKQAIQSHEDDGSEVFF